MNFWIISLFDPTPLDEPIFPRFIEIAKSAVNQGHSVKHFTSTFRHTKKAHRFIESRRHQVMDNYEVIFTHSMAYKKNMSPKRFIAHKFYAEKLIHEFKAHEKPDLIFISMPPLSTISMVADWGKKHNVPVVIDIIDPWPDSFIKDVPFSLKPIARKMIFGYYRILRRSFENAAAITAISNGYLNWAKTYHSISKINCAFFLAIDVDEVQKIVSKVQKPPLAKRPLRLIYAGSFASSYDIPSILKAAEIINHRYPRRTEFVFTGKGPQFDLIKKYAEKLDNVQYLGWLDREELLKEYGMADLGLIQHKNSLTQTITYKFFNYMSAGLVLLNSLQTEMAEMIDQYGLGKNNKEEDYRTLAENISYYIGNPTELENQKIKVLEFTREYGHTNRVYGKLVSLLTEVAKKSV